MDSLHAVILAAGRGSRLQAEEGHKLLSHVLDLSMIEHHLQHFADMGLRQLTIVTGYQAEALRRQLEPIHHPDIEIFTTFNPDWQLSNGLSVLSAIDGPHQALHNPQAQPPQTVPFWLVMSDHLLQPGLPEHVQRKLKNLQATRDDQESSIEGALAVDAKIDTIYDIPDATKVALHQDGSLAGISKELDHYDLIDAGLFYCAQGFVDALRAAKQERGDCSTSDAVKALAAQGRFAFVDVDHFTWQDVDTPGAQAHAETLLHRWRQT